MHFGSEILLAACWLLGLLLLIVAYRTPLGRLLVSRRLDKPPKPFSGKVWVVDGDTICVGRARVRLFGMDAPELTQHGG